MKYYTEQQQKKRQQQYQRQTQRYIQEKEDNMMKNITQIHCRLLRHCLNKEKKCMVCSKNTYRDTRYPPVDYFKPLVPGITVLP